jgi:hypothetical protein
MVKVKRRLEDFVLYAAASETKVNPIATIDINIADGIVRTSKEIIATTIVMGWPMKETFIDKIFGQKNESIFNLTDKTIILYNHAKPLNTNKKIKVVCPPSSEFETGFYYWLNKVAFLANELSLSVEFFCNQNTQNAIDKVIVTSKSKIICTYSNFFDFNDFLILSKQINTDDLLVVVSSRKGSVSYQSSLENIPKLLDKYFTENNLILLYTSTGSGENKFDEYSDVSAAFVSKGIETAAKIQKGIGNIFKNKNTE